MELVEEGVDEEGNEQRVIIIIGQQYYSDMTLIML